MLSLEAITPKTQVIATDVYAQAQAYIGNAGFAGGMIRRMANYPPQQPPFGSRQSLGVKAGARTRKRSTLGPRQYRRTGTLGRNWRITFNGIRGNDLVTEVTNATEYGVYVEGPKVGDIGKRQTAVMASKGWPNITDAAALEWAIWRPGIVRLFAQQGARLAPL